MTPLKYDKSKDNGWQLLSNKTPPITKFEIVEVLRKGENAISGEELLKRAKQGHLDLGQNIAEYLLEHRDEIPKEWRSYDIVFPGTVWQDSGGSRYVPYLYWRGGRWYLFFYWLEYVWYSNDRLLRAVKPSGTRKLGKEALGTSVATITARIRVGNEMYEGTLTKR